MATKPADLARELEALAERPRTFSETDEPPPRGRHPGLFRAARAAGLDAATDSQQATLLEKLAAELALRLTDEPLLEPIAELARDVPLVREGLIRAFASAPEAQRWAYERQLAVLQKIQPGELPLERALALAADEPGLDVPGLDAPGDARLALLRELVEVRLACPTARRDRPSAAVARGALRLLAQEAPRESASLATRAVEVETRRAGKDDPVVALAAIEVLRGAEPLEKLRAARALEKRIERRVIQDRLAGLASEAQAAIGASPEEVFELLAEDAGLDARGELRVVLEGGAHVLVTIAPSGKAGSRNSPDLARALDADERREVEGALAQVGRVRREHAVRLEKALVAGRAWRLALFRESFAGSQPAAPNPILRDLASRLVWLAVPEKGALVSFRVARPGESDREADGHGLLEDVFGGALPELGEGTRVRVAHPSELDPDELDLWRERFRTLAAGARLVQPFPQLFRAAFRETDAAKLAKFPGREAYRDDLVELGRAHGLRGLPLRGDGPWELARDFPGRGAVLALVVEPIAGYVAPVKPRREPVKVLDDQDPRRPRAPREAAPRVRVTKAELAGAPDAVAISESLAFLHTLTDELAVGTDAYFGEWQRAKHKDPHGAWKQAQERLGLGSGAQVRARLAWLLDLGAKLETKGRFACYPGPLFLDLGSRHAFEGELCDWVPPWKLDQRVKAAGDLALASPHEPETDPDGVRVVETALALARSLSRGTPA